MPKFVFLSFKHTTWTHEYTHRQKICFVNLFHALRLVCFPRTFAPYLQTNKVINTWYCLCFFPCYKNYPWFHFFKTVFHRELWLVTGGILQSISPYYWWMCTDEEELIKLVTVMPLNKNETFVLHIFWRLKIVKVKSPQSGSIFD